ncbi:PP2C family protein-serine/threonine phosphatase [Granulicella paludicola]|uniref:PP2C family protein-serine/threonine phosphatase n=1 Tax=Granulicella paludicola TaxID=474951 RepID=UPI0021E0DA4E|nr:protein phosphatase 2C domain-containing protein [Granulicella paludicola]
MLSLDFAEQSDTGKVRDHNEDALGHVLPVTAAEVQSRGWFFALADGMGGHDSGEVASNLAIKTALEGFQKIPKGVMHVSLLPRLVQEANASVYDAGHASGTSQRGRQMGTTFVGCALRFDSAVISHVGDSRCYQYRNGHLTCLTHDHTLAVEQLRMGLVTKEEADEGESRHVLTRSLGSELFVAADTITVNVLPQDVLLLCSDGLHGYVPDAVIQHTLMVSRDLKTASKSLIDAALQAGGHDNVSVQLIHILTVERMGLYRGRPYRLL